MRRPNDPTGENREALENLMESHAISRARVAEICGVGESTVHRWFAPEEGGTRIGVPTYAVRLVRAAIVDDLEARAAEDDVREGRF
jgi:AraC-like DNA-binding protein